MWLAPPQGGAGSASSSSLSWAVLGWLLMTLESLNTLLPVFCIGVVALRGLSSSSSSNSSSVSSRLRGCEPEPTLDTLLMLPFTGVVACETLLSVFRSGVVTCDTLPAAPCAAFDALLTLLLRGLVAWRGLSKKSSSSSCSLKGHLLRVPGLTLRGTSSSSFSSLALLREPGLVWWGRSSSFSSSLIFQLWRCRSSETALAFDALLVLPCFAAPALRGVSASSSSSLSRGLPHGVQPPFASLALLWTGVVMALGSGSSPSSSSSLARPLAFWGISPSSSASSSSRPLRSRAPTPLAFSAAFAAGAPFS
mmetsp:Transcript_106731/g.301870  ORF Transcript_106731/g.301870 Transcript_106731/m.301870 type:complete len:308 (+) Transcript_106731:123-1046(+)